MTDCASSCCHSGAGKAPVPWWRRRITAAAALTFLLFAASAVIPALSRLHIELLFYFKMVFWPFALGLLLGGMIDYFVPREYISKHLTRGRKRTIVYAVGLGFMASACSHGIIALAMELHKKGASGPAVIAFLLASPWASLPITLLLIGFFGAKAFVIIFSALFVAFTTGLIFQALDRKGWIDKNRHSVPVPEGFSVRKDVRRRVRAYRWSLSGVGRDLRGVARGIDGLLDMVAWWVLLGILLASFAGAFVPGNIFRDYFGPNLLGLLVTLGLATVLEVCSECTSPLAFELYHNTAAFGNAFVFLMGGVVTDYTEVGLVWANLGRRTALWMLAVAIPQVVVLGWLYNRIF
ncbi:MAG: permease [Candidatus Omnitrophota bacterium]|jgi:hypothetical protein